MKELSILLAILLFLATFAVSNTYVQAAGPAGGGGSAGYGLLGPGSLAPFPGVFCLESPGWSGMGPRRLEPFYSPGTNTGRDNDKPGLDIGTSAGRCRQCCM